MPNTVCPICGARTHVNTGAPGRFEDRHPELMEVGIAVRVCIGCSDVLSIGDSVVVVSALMKRPKASAVPIGSLGSIEKISTTADGYSIFRVTLDSGYTTNFLRGELHRQRDGG